MKYIYTTVIFLVFLFFITSTIDFNYSKEVNNIDMSNNQISKIVINLKDANVSLSSTIDKDVKIEHIYSKEQQPTSNLYTYQEDDTLYVNEYPYNKSNLISKKETINIYIPEEYVFDDIEIVSDNGQVNVDSLNTSTLDVVSESGNVDVANLNTDVLDISGGQFGVNVSNVVADKFNSDIAKVQYNITNSIIDEMVLSNTEASKVKIDKLVTNEVTIDGANTDVELILNPDLDYQIKTQVVVGNTQFDTLDEGYAYTPNDTKKVVMYDLSNIHGLTVLFEEIEVEQGEEDE